MWNHNVIPHSSRNEAITILSTSKDKLMSHILFKKSKIEKKKSLLSQKNMKTCDLGKIKASRWTINSKELVQAKVRENKNCKERTTKKIPQQRTNWWLQTRRHKGGFYTESLVVSLTVTKSFWEMNTHVELTEHRVGEHHEEWVGTKYFEP